MHVAKTKALISCSVTGPLFLIMQKAGFLIMRLILWMHFCIVWYNKKKSNKQCLFDTPRTVMVNIENDVRIRRPQNICKKQVLS